MLRGQGLALIFLLFMASLPALHATTILPMTMDDLFRESPVIVYGKVVQMEVNPQGFRTAIVEALDVPRAPENLKQQRDFAIPLLNRAIPRSDLVDVVSMAPELKVLEEVFLFLEPVRAGQEGPYARLDSTPLFTLKGFFQGKLRIFEDQKGVRRAGAWNEIPETVLEHKELKKEKTTPRMSLRAQATLSVEDLKVDSSKLSNLRTLDELLNRARGDSHEP